MDKNAVTDAIIKLFETERFYAEIIGQMKRIVGDRVPTAGVCIRDQIELHINPKFFETLTIDQRVAVLKHECEHILRGHIERSKELAPEIYNNEKKELADHFISQMKHRTINIAADCAINYGLPNLPEGGAYPKTFDLKNGETLEWYLHHLKDNDKAKDFMEIEGHELWGESESDKELLKEKIRQAINKAAENARSAGQLTSDQELLVANLNKVTEINWQAQLKRFVARSVMTKVDTSKKRRNRRYGVMYPGIVKEDELHIGVAIDTSGSVSDEALRQFMVEIGFIAKYAKVTVVEADSTIKNTYVFDPKKTYKVSGRGGTAYQPAFDFFNKTKGIDGILYFGDMDCFDHENIKKPKYPVLWCIVGNQEPPAKFGSRVKVKVNEK